MCLKKSGEEKERDHRTVKKDASWFQPMLKYNMLVKLGSFPKEKCFFWKSSNKTPPYHLGLPVIRDGGRHLPFGLPDWVPPVKVVQRRMAIEVPRPPEGWSRRGGKKDGQFLVVKLSHWKKPFLLSTILVGLIGILIMAYYNWVVQSPIYPK